MGAHQYSSLSLDGLRLRGASVSERRGLPAYREAGDEGGIPPFIPLPSLPSARGGELLG